MGQMLGCSKAVLAKINILYQNYFTLFINSEPKSTQLTSFDSQTAILKNARFHCMAITNTRCNTSKSRMNLFQSSFSKKYALTSRFLVSMDRSSLNSVMIYISVLTDKNRLHFQNISAFYFQLLLMENG